MSNLPELNSVKTYDCLTSNDIERIFLFGASERESHHLSNCYHCMHEVGLYCRIPQRCFTVETSESNKLIHRLRRLVNRGETALYTSVLLSMKNKEITVTENLDSIKIELKVVAPQDFFPRANGITLRLSGAVNAYCPKFTDAEESQLVFETAVFSKRIRESLKNHYCVTDCVRLDGLYIDSVPLFGQINVTFCKRTSDSFWKIVY